jgi:hypothetical protein
LGSRRTERYFEWADSEQLLQGGFITQAIRAGKAERRVKEHSDHESWKTFNQHISVSHCAIRGDPPED